MLVTSLLISINKLILADVNRRTVLNNEYNLEIEGVNWEKDRSNWQQKRKAEVMKFSLNF